MERESNIEQMSWYHYVGIFLFSLATLLLELALTRVLSVALWYHFGFLIISTALLGFGASGVVLALWRRLREQVSLDRALASLALAFVSQKARNLGGFCFALCFFVFALAFFAPGALPFSVPPKKQNPPRPPIYTAWNTFSRIDLYEAPPNPQTHAPGTRRFIFDAGTAGTGIEDLRPGVRDYLSRNQNDEDYHSGIAYVGKQNPRVLIIGSGGGAQVLDALHFGARDVTAVEINPIINEVVSRRMSDYWGGLFNQPEVRLVTEEGRSYVRRSREQYDAIISVHTISNAALASGAVSLAENYVLTREAFEDYLDHLTPDGVIYFTRPEQQIARLFATAREALAARGIANPAAHLYAYSFTISPQSFQTAGT